MSEPDGPSPLIEEEPSDEVLAPEVELVCGADVGPTPAVAPESPLEPVPPVLPWGCTCGVDVAEDDVAVCAVVAPVDELWELDVSGPVDMDPGGWELHAAKSKVTEAG